MGNALSVQDDGEKFQDEPHMNCDKTPYSSHITTYVRMVYIIAALIWIGIIIVFELYTGDLIEWLILFIPFTIYGFGFCNASCLCKEVEDNLFRANYLTIGLIVILPLISWVSREYSERGAAEAKRFKSLLVLAVILILMSMLDVWVSRNWLSVQKHAKSAIQTMAVGLLIFAFYNYYLLSHEHPHLMEA